MADRPDDQRCRQCRFFRPHPGTETSGYHPPSSWGAVAVIAGSCHRRPPHCTASGEGRFPVLYEAQWCGEWEPDRPVTFDDTAAAMARAVLAGDLVAARALADRLEDLPTDPVPAALPEPPPAVATTLGPGPTPIPGLWDTFRVGGVPWDDDS